MGKRHELELKRQVARLQAKVGGLRDQLDHQVNMTIGWKEQALNLSIAVEIRDQQVNELKERMENHDGVQPA